MPIIFEINCIRIVRNEERLQINSILVLLYAYMMGAYISTYRIRFIEKKPSLMCFALCLGSFFMILTIRCIKVENQTITNWINYVGTLRSVFTLTTAVLIFYSFLKLDIKNNKVINYFSSLTIAIYLFHEHPLMRKILWSNIFVIENTNVFIELLKGIIAVICIYTIVAILELIRKNVFEKIVFKSKIINKLSNKIDVFLYE